MHWFSGKRTFIDGGVYMCLNGGVASRVFICFHVVLHFYCGHQMFLLVSGVSKDSVSQELLRFILSRQYQQIYIDR